MEGLLLLLLTSLTFRFRLCSSSKTITTGANMDEHERKSKAKHYSNTEIERCLIHHHSRRAGNHSELTTGYESCLHLTGLIKGKFKANKKLHALIGPSANTTEVRE